MSKTNERLHKSGRYHIEQLGQERASFEPDNLAWMDRCRLAVPGNLTMDAPDGTLDEEAENIRNTNSNVQQLDGAGIASHTHKNASSVSPPDLAAPLPDSYLSRDTIAVLQQPNHLPMRTDGNLPGNFVADFDKCERPAPEKSHKEIPPDHLYLNPSMSNERYVRNSVEESHHWWGQNFLPAHLPTVQDHDLHFPTKEITHEPPSIVKPDAITNSSDWTSAIWQVQHNDVGSDSSTGWPVHSNRENTMPRSVGIQDPEIIKEPNFPVYDLSLDDAFSSSRFQTKDLPLSESAANHDTSSNVAMLPLPGWPAQSQDVAPRVKNGITIQINAPLYHAGTNIFQSPQKMIDELEARVTDALLRILRDANEHS